MPGIPKTKLAPEVYDLMLHLSHVKFMDSYFKEEEIDSEFLALDRLFTRGWRLAAED